MKTKYFLHISCYFALTLQWAFSQGGSLVPTAPPQVIFKTLQEVEPRTLINSLPFTISEAGSYYLVSNLVDSTGANGITIDASDVTLDLNGFSLLGNGSGFDGININAGVENVLIQNGTIRDWTGIGIDGFSASNCIFRTLRLIENAIGLSSGNNARVEKCDARRNTTTGIGLVAGCRATDNISSENGTANLHASGNGNLIKNNQLTDGGIGLDIDGTGNHVSENTVNGNGNNYSMLEDNNLRLLISEIPETIEWDGAHVLITGNLTG
ncbi:MAG: right-handed parallel beta-helix repeat-containing protein, partial [Verrucomicrobiota bacterium]